MANDIYFGSGRKQNGADANDGARRPPARPPVTREADVPAETASPRGPATSGQARQTRPQSAAGRETERFGEPVRGTVVRNAADEHPVTEQIDRELLHRAPTQIPFHYIDTEGSFEDFGNQNALTERQKKKRRNQTLKAAKKSARKTGRKKSGFGRFLKAVLCVLLALAVLIGGACAYVITGYKPLSLDDNAYVSDASLLSHPAVYNLLLMGIDTQNTSDTSRSDSMILLSVDNVHSKLKMTSFMRDCYVTIPGYGDAKLNAACTYGGPQLVCDTIEYNFGVRIDGYAKIGFDLLTELVDGLGGITIPEVDAVEAAALAAAGYDAPIGADVKMNGAQTLLYCRIRKGQSDFYRTARQREVLEILIKKALRTNPVKLAILGRRLLARAECSVSQAELFALAFRLAPCLLGGTASERIPQDGTWYDDTRNYQAVLVVNFEENTAFLNSFIYG